VEFFSLSAQWRSSAPQSSTTIHDPLLAGAEETIRPAPFYDQYNARIPGYSYLDLTAVWHALANLELPRGVTNLLDKDHRSCVGRNQSNSGPANSYPTYDYLGRSCSLRSRQNSRR